MWVRVREGLWCRGAVWCVDTGGEAGERYKRSRWKGNSWSWKTINLEVRKRSSSPSSRCFQCNCLTAELVQKNYVCSSLLVTLWILAESRSLSSTERSNICHEKSLQFSFYLNSFSFLLVIFYRWWCMSLLSISLSSLFCVTHFSCHN